MTSLRTSTIASVNAIALHRVIIGLVATMGAFAAQAADSATMKLPMQGQKDYFSEKCFTLERGQQLAYKLNTRHPIEFNVHHHPAEGDTLYPDRLIVKSQHAKQIVAESAGAYCFMATNLNDQPSDFDVVITYEITN
jgi:hypothetical protein